ncbi:hypothetical protein GCM10009425_40510 [Pseudomonas asuensis]|uniref:XRE family transcriptional regulator n=1 Tax=Pseudomonas asuensis TaxID=1825787 RepID=A0ABQ2H2Y7_9PSED|nr:hypothetical protein [Pseudomonas asuensis]GGM25641.1 hypothetical protein GCM10009425_40510 [Pseudomonas asuensis]
MNNLDELHELHPFRGTDLERWRIENGLSKPAAADAFGLQKAKWEELTNTDNSAEPITDPVIAMLLYLYREYPESSPIVIPPNVVEFYDFLGFTDSPQDRDKFATLIGRTPPTAYRILLHGGNAGRPVVKWIEGLKRLKLTPKKTQRLMADVVSTVGARQGVSKVLIQGWTKQGDSGEHE